MAAAKLWAVEESRRQTMDEQPSASALAGFGQLLGLLAQVHDHVCGERDALLLENERLRDADERAQHRESAGTHPTLLAPSPRALDSARGSVLKPVPRLCLDTLHAGGGQPLQPRASVDAGEKPVVSSARRASGGSTADALGHRSGPPAADESSVCLLPMATPRASSSPRSGATPRGASTPLRWIRQKLSSRGPSSDELQPQQAWDPVPQARISQPLGPTSPRAAFASPRGASPRVSPRPDHGRAMGTPSPSIAVPRLPPPPAALLRSFSGGAEGSVSGGAEGRGGLLWQQRRRQHSSRSLPSTPVARPLATTAPSSASTVCRQSQMELDRVPAPHSARGQRPCPLAPGHDDDDDDDAVPSPGTPAEDKRRSSAEFDDDTGGISEGDLGPRLPEEWEVGPNAQLARNLRKGRPLQPVGWADAEDPEPHDMSARELHDDAAEQEMCASIASKASFAMQFPSQLPSLRSEASFGMQFPSPVSEAGRFLGNLCSPRGRCDSEVYASEKLAGQDGDHTLYSQQVQTGDLMTERCGEEEIMRSNSIGSQWLKEDRTSQVSQVVLAKWGHVVSQLMLAQEGEHALREWWRADDAEKGQTKQFGASMEAVVMLWEKGRKSEDRLEIPGGGARRGRHSFQSAMQSVIPKRTAGGFSRRSNSSGSLSGRAGSFITGPKRAFRPRAFVQSLVWHPLCAKRTIWVILGLLFISYELLMLSLEVFELGEVSALGVMELITTIFWTIDIPLSFITGIFVKGEVEMRLKMIARSYATSWMSLDVMLVLVNWVLILIPKDGNTTALEVVRYVRHTRFLRLARLAKFDRLLRPLLQRINSTIIVLMIKSLIILMLVVLWVHCNGCIWFAIGSSRSTGWVELAGLKSLPIYQQYLLSTHWAVAQLQGNVDIHPGYDNAGERAYAVIYTFASIGVLAAFVSKLTNIMLELQEINNKQAEELRIICDVLSRHRISAELSMRVRSYLRFKQTVDQKREAATKEVLDKLPIELRKALVHEMRTPHISGHQILGLIRQLHERTMRRVCCDAMQQHSPVLGEGIYSYGERCSAMYIVAAGDLTYHKYGVVAQVLMRNQRGRRRADNDLARKSHFGPVPVSVGQGHWLCEAALWVNWLHRGDLSVLSQAWYLTLEASSFASIVADHLITKQALVFHASRFARSMDAVSMMFASDFFDTECAIEAARELIMPELDRWSTSYRSSESSG